MHVTLDINTEDHPALLVTLRAALDAGNLAHCDVIACVPDQFLAPAWQPHPWPEFDSDRYRK